jgi:hypothetical protein
MAKGQKTGGRSKGTPNKITHDVRQNILDVADKLGGTARLLQWAKADPGNERIFWSQIYVRVLPKEIKAEVSGLSTSAVPVINLTLNHDPKPNRD